MIAMSPYQVTIEGVFVRSPELAGDIGGFYATFFLRANNATNAVRRAGDIMDDRMNSHGVTRLDGKAFNSYFCVHDLWEVSEDRFCQREGQDSGFTFFKINWFQRISLVLRFIFLKKFKPWLLVRAKSEVKRGRLG